MQAMAMLLGSNEARACNSRSLAVILFCPSLRLGIEFLKCINRIGVRGPPDMMSASEGERGVMEKWT